MSDIAITKLKSFGPLSKFQVRRAGNGFASSAHNSSRIMVTEQNFEQNERFEHCRQAE